MEENVVLDYLTAGIDFTLPGNGGPECRDFISGSKRFLESVFALTVCGLSFFLGWKWHRRPPCRVASAPPSYEYSPTRIILLVSMTFTYGMEVCYKFATRQAVFVVNPCHMLCVIQIVLLALPNNSVWTTYLFRFHLYFMHGPWMAVLLPVTNTLFLPLEYTTYWTEHALLVIIPFYLLSQGGYFTVEPRMDFSWALMTYGAWGLYHFVFLDVVGLVTLGNVNSMLCPAISDPFYGPHWRMVAIGHQFLLNLLAGKLHSLAGQVERPQQDDQHMGKKDS